MTPDDFAAALVQIALAGADGFMRYLEAPSGRTPPPGWVRRSEWFNTLDEDDRAAIADLVREACLGSARTMCGVLDGNVASEPAGPKGELVLSYVGPDGASVRLNDPGRRLLDDAFASAATNA